MHHCNAVIAVRKRKVIKIRKEKVRPSLFSDDRRGENPKEIIFKGATVIFKRNYPGGRIQGWYKTHLHFYIPTMKNWKVKVVNSTKALSQLNEERKVFFHIGKNEPRLPPHTTQKWFEMDHRTKCKSQNQKASRKKIWVHIFITWTRHKKH